MTEDEALEECKRRGWVACWVYEVDRYDRALDDQRFEIGDQIYRLRGHGDSWESAFADADNKPYHFAKPRT